MSKKEITYIDLYADDDNNPTAVKRSGLSGFWAALPPQQSKQRWIEQEVKPENPTDSPAELAPRVERTPFAADIRTLCVADRRGNFNVGIKRSLEFIRFMADSGFDFNDKKIAEPGCGNGKLSILASNAGATVHAFDPSKKELQLLHWINSYDPSHQESRKCLSQISSKLASPVPGLLLPGQASGESLPLKKESMDAVMIKFSLQWMEDQKAIAEMERILRPGGELFIMTTTQMAGMPDLYCRAWNSLVNDMKTREVTFKNFESPKNPIPMHHLPSLVEYMEMAGFSFCGQKHMLEETVKNHRYFVVFLTNCFREQLRFCLEGSHSLSDQERNKILTQKMEKIAEENGLRPSVFEDIAMLHFKKQS